MEDKSTDSLTGTKHYHFWAEKTKEINFDLEQEVKDLASGTYKYAISVMGGDAVDPDIYAYVKINGKIVATGAATITVYNEWHTGRIDSFDYTAGDTLTVGIHVECKPAGNGAWGKIDDAMLNSVAK